MKLTPNFTKAEFMSKDGSHMPDDVLVEISHLARQLQELRNYIGKPVNINSGYRSPIHNRKVGGSPNSLHMRGRAADISVPGMTPKEVMAAIDHLIETGKMVAGGRKAYASWVHYDTRGYNVKF